MQNVNEIMSEELAAVGLDADRLDEASRCAIQAITPVLDNAITAIGEQPEALRVAVAALRSYARVADQYAAALDAHTADR